jgi:hypothetical protein
MPVKFGLGVAVNTNADGLGDFLPLGNIGVFAGTLFGSEVSAYATNACAFNSNLQQNTSSNCALPGTTEGYYPPAVAGYTHIQMGTIPTIEVMTMKPINNASYSAWLTEAHLNQFEAGLSSATTAYTGGSASGTYSANANINSVYPTANITFGGASVNYSNEGTKFAGEFDYFRGHIISSSQAFGYVGMPIYMDTPGDLPGTIYFANGYSATPTYNLNDFLPVPVSGNNQYDGISSYDLYLTGSQLLNTSTPMSLGFKFGIGAPIAQGDYNFTYYSTIQNTKTLFGDVIGSSWQPIQFNAPGLSYIYGGAAGEAVGPNLSNKYAIMVDAKEFLPSNNTLKESLIHAAWLQTQIGSTQEFGGSNIGTELDINFTHHFTKTLAWQAWVSYVWTGSGVESASYTTTPYYSSPTTQNSTTLLGYQTTDNGFANSQTKNITALGTDISWNF